MPILVDRDTRVIVHGITSRYGSDQTRAMLAYGTRVVAGVALGRGGERFGDVPIWDTVAEAVAATPADAAIVYVPAAGAADAAVEACEAGLRLVVVAAEGVPLHDALRLRRVAAERGAWVVGPNSLGLVTPEACMLGAFPRDFTRAGDVGVISRSGTMSIHVARILSKAGLGQSTCVSVGGDQVLGRNPAEYLELFARDAATRAMVMVGEIGGRKEYEVADLLPALGKPLVAYIAGRTAPRGRRMGHVGAFVGEDEEGAEPKIERLRAAGALVATTPWEIPALVAKAMVSGRGAVRTRVSLETGRMRWRRW